MASGARPVAEPRVFRVFISYASEDLPIAEAIGTCLKVALGDYFAEVNLDKWFLQPGLPFEDQIGAEVSNRGGARGKNNLDEYSRARVGNQK